MRTLLSEETRINLGGRLTIENLTSGGRRRGRGDLETLRIVWVLIDAGPSANADRGAGVTSGLLIRRRIPKKICEDSHSATLVPFTSVLRRDARSQGTEQE